MIFREMQEKILTQANQYPFVAITGSRQSGEIYPFTESVPRL